MDLKEQIKEKSHIIFVFIFYAFLTVIYFSFLDRYSYRNSFQYVMLLLSTFFSLVFSCLIFYEKQPSKWLVFIPSFTTIFLLLTSPVYYHPASLPNDDARWISIVVLMYTGSEYPNSGIFFNFFKIATPQGLPMALSALYVITGMNIFVLIKLFPFFLAYVVPLVFYLISYAFFRNRRIALLSAMFSLYYIFGSSDAATFIYGFAPGGYQAFAGIMLLFVLFYYVKRGKTLKNNIFAGLFTGLLAYIHPFTFIAAFLIILGLSLAKLTEERFVSVLFKTFLVLVIAFCLSVPYVYHFSTEETLTPPDADFLRATGVGLEGGRGYANLEMGKAIQSYILFGLLSLRSPFEVGLEQFFYLYHFTLIYKIRFIALICSLVGIYVLAKTKKSNFSKIILPIFVLFSFMILIYQFDSLAYVSSWRFPGFAIYFAPLTAGYGLPYLLNKLKVIDHFFLKKSLLALLIVLASTTGIIEATTYYGGNYYPISEDLHQVGIWLNANTPLESIIASFPKESDTLRGYALRETVCSDEVGGFTANYIEAYDIWKERVVDTFQVFFTENEDVLKAYIKEYKVNYFVVILEYFSESYRQMDRPYWNLSPIIKPYLENTDPIILSELSFLLRVYSTTQIIVLKVLND